MQEEAGIRLLALNGCPACNKFVFLPEDPRQVCPTCGGPRYDSLGKPLEAMSCLLFTLFANYSIFADNLFACFTARVVFPAKGKTEETFL